MMNSFNFMSEYFNDQVKCFRYFTFVTYTSP